jgi:hypothetical protein
VAGVFALALVVGYQTRLVTLCSLVLLVSLHVRNPMVLNAGDSLLRRVLFWSLFLPLGRRWSVDALRRGRAGGADQIVSLATIGLLAQVVVVYVVNALFKLRGETWLRGTALHTVFALDQLTTPLGGLLGEVPLLLTALDWLWLAMVVCAPLLVVLTGWRRTAFVGLFVGGHLGMLATLRLGVFPLVSVVVLLPFLPPWVWTAVEARVVRPAGSWLPLDPAGRGQEPRRSDGGTFATHLDRVGVWLGRARPVAVALLLVTLLCWNAATLGHLRPPDAVTERVDPSAYAWDMFAPEPRNVDGWYVVDGRLASGERVDPFRGGDVRFDRPPDVAATFPSHRWLVYLLDLQRPAGEPLRDRFGTYLCERWNAGEGAALERVTVYYVRQPVVEGAKPGRVELTTRSCR